MKLKKVYFFSNQWLWILVTKNGLDYFYRFDQIKGLTSIEKRMRERETKTIDNLKQLNIKITKNTCKGFYVAQYLKEKKWTQLLCQTYCLDPNILKKHIESH
jgi:hypothetical protein